MNTNRCLSTKNNDPTSPVLEECANTANQRWVMKTKFKWQASKDGEGGNGHGGDDEDN